MSVLVRQKESIEIYTSITLNEFDLDFLRKVKQQMDNISVCKVLRYMHPSISIKEAHDFVASFM